jgi:hypothetical protein
MNKFLVKIPVITTLLILLNSFNCYAIEFKGMSYVGWSEFACSTPDSNQSIADLKDTGCQWVAIPVFWFQDATTATDIYPDYSWYSVRPESIKVAVDRCHQLGMKVMLKPMLDIKTGQWRAYIEPNNSWFAEYHTFINYWADFAEQNDIEMLCIGCELENTATNPSWANAWRSVANDIRTHYSGPITYATNHGGESTVLWWDAVDYIGIDAYYSLTDVDNPTPAQLANAWTNRANLIQNWRNIYWPSKDVIFTEAGYSSFDGTNRWPWLWPPPSGVDVNEQADCYAALLSVCRQRPWWKGVFWWNWETNPAAGGLADKGFTPQNKPAEQALKDYYITITGDMNDDRKVDLYDVSMFVSYWPNQSIVGWPDFNNDKKIDFKDFALLASNWRQSIPLP